MHSILVWLVLAFIAFWSVPLSALSDDSGRGMILDAYTFPGDGAPLEVCLLRGEKAAVVVLSDDLSGHLSGLKHNCLTEASLSPSDAGEAFRPVPRCGPTGGCLGPSLFCWDLCDEFQGIGRYGRFMLYRQVEGEEFQELGLFTDSPSCTVTHDGNVPMSRIDDPALFLLCFEIGGIYAQAPEEARLTETTRLVFADRSVRSAGNRVRYKLVVFDPESGAPRAIHNSGWLQW